MYKNLSQLVKELQKRFKSLIQFEKDFYEDLGSVQIFSTSSDLTQDQKENKEYLEEMIEKSYNHIKKKLTTFLQYPPCHAKHEEQLKYFHQVAGFEESVFIMTKYPDEENELEKNSELKRVIDIVKKTIKECGYCPRLASEDRYYPQLWDNVELYLLGCRKGVAILEDCYNSELNPNVAMEWGWMRGMGKDVLCLVEKNFTHQRADWKGLIEDSFDWKKPEDKIKPAIKRWLKN